MGAAGERVPALRLRRARDPRSDHLDVRPGRGNAGVDHRPDADPARFACFLARGISTFVDVAGDARYVWRPDDEAIDAAGIVYVRIPLEDTNVDLPNAAFDAVRDALDGADGETLLFCAAGLKRAPHLLYGVLRARGHGGQHAWELIRQARPMTDRFEPYIAAAERWAARWVTP